MGKWTKKERLSLLFWLAAVCAVCALPFANHDLAAGHDALFHILRIEGLAQGLKGGAGWPQPVYSLFCGGYGYAAGLFYPDLFLLPAALLRAAGLGPELAFKLEVLLFMLLAALFSYLAGRAVCRSHRGGLLVMILYSLCQYHFANLYIRSALGEIQAMAFLPLVVWGLYDLTEEDFKHPWLLCAGFTGLLLTHTISLALCGLLAVVWVLCRVRRVLKARILLRLGGTAGVCLLLGAYYWAPLLEQFASDTFKVTTEPLTKLAYNVVPAGAFFSLQSYMAPGFSSLAMLAAGLIALALLYRRHKGGMWRANAMGLALLAAGAVLAVLPLAGLIPWQVLDNTFLTSVQFPWRINMLSQFCLALGCARLVTALPGPRGWRPAVTAGAAFVLSLVNVVCLWGSLPALCNYPGNYFTSQRGETFYLVGQEWVPQGGDITEFAFEPNAQYTNQNGAFTGAYRPDGAFTLAFDGTAGAYGIPKLYYKGYTAVYTPADGGRAAALPLHKDGAGRVELTVPAGLAPGSITVRYAGTPVQHVSACVSLLTLAALAVWALRRVKAKRTIVE